MSELEVAGRAVVGEPKLDNRLIIAVGRFLKDFKGWWGGLDKNQALRYVYFIDTSTWGEDCGYAAAYLKIWNGLGGREKDLEKLREMRDRLNTILELPNG